MRNLDPGRFLPDSVRNLQRPPGKDTGNLRWCYVSGHYQIYFNTFFPRQSAITTQNADSGPLFQASVSGRKRERNILGSVPWHRVCTATRTHLRWCCQRQRQDPLRGRAVTCAPAPTRHQLTLEACAAYGTAGRPKQRAASLCSVRRALGPPVLGLEAIGALALGWKPWEEVVEMLMSRASHPSRTLGCIQPRVRVIGGPWVPGDPPAPERSLYLPGIVLRSL